MHETMRRANNAKSKICSLSSMCSPSKRIGWDYSSELSGSPEQRPSGADGIAKFERRHPARRMAAEFVGHRLRSLDCRMLRFGWYLPRKLRNGRCPRQRLPDLIAQ